MKLTDQTPVPSHLPVLFEPIMERASGATRIVDATLGHGGHAAGFLKAGAEVLGIDRDPDAIAIAKAHLGGKGIRYLETIYSSDESLQAIEEFGPDFIFLDLGVSSRQLDDSSRGFTFRPGAPLDMRMGPNSPTAAEWLMGADRDELVKAFRDWADERRASRLADEVIRRRPRGFEISDDLVNAIRSVLGARSGPGDFARIFQGVRIAVNDELAGLEIALPAFRDSMIGGGILAVISYHSGEDRLVKHAFREWSAGCICPPAFPQCACGRTPLGEASPRRAVVPRSEEIATNSRSRSAKLRFFQLAKTT